jgi:hypothetical protein
MAVNDYTGNLDSIEADEKNEKADLKLSQDVSDAYIKAITTSHQEFESIRTSMNGLDKITGNVGTFTSANSAKTALENAVNGFSGVQFTTDQHVTYQRELGKAVKAAHDLLIKSG